ncbi:protein kinase G-activating protein GlnX [Rugosimonospora acidiphila]|uniref:Protein kinase G-activating protein GlnX n=1 Tax=Rugosimonospora acidiphila TaxID=556531 RepID=A0ABP9RLR7_9ACTN
MVLILVSAALLTVTTVGMMRTRDQVDVVGAYAAPQAATASDLYLALSDLDAQVARLIMIGDSESLSDSRLDALLTYRQRSNQVDADLSQALNTATTASTRTQLRTLTSQLALYRQLAWEALAVQEGAADQVPGRPPADTLGYYSRATTLLHADLLPSAKSLRSASETTLNDAYSGQRSTARWSLALAVLFGVLGVILLLGLQVRLARRFRRLINPALLAATLATIGLVVAAGVVFTGETNRLDAAQRDSFAPYLSLTAAQAVSYDAAGDTSRYLISGNPEYVQQDLAAKSKCLVNGGTCGSGGDDLSAGLGAFGRAPGSTGPGVLDRWNAYQRDHDQIVALSGDGQLATAVNRLTGISRGDANFDFFYYDTAVSQITASRKAGFDATVADARHALAGWTVIPAVLMGVAMLLVLLGVRPRLAEYR